MCHELEFANEKRVRSTRPEVFYKKEGLRNFTKFTGIHLCQSPNKSGGWGEGGKKISEGDVYWRPKNK